MSAVENTSVLRRWIEEGWNNRNHDALDNLAAPDFIDHHLPPGLPPTLEGQKLYLRGVAAGIPDGHVAIEDLIVCEDREVARMRVTGTQTGEFNGLPPTGRSFEITAIGIARIVNGKLAEYWENADRLGLMQQLGMIPVPGKEADVPVPAPETTL